MSIYDINYTDQVENNLPVEKRKPGFISWLVALLSAQKWRSDIFFNEYVQGSSAALWSPFVTLYPKGTRVNFFRSIYEATRSVPSGHFPTDANYWIKITEDYRGVNERVRYNSQKIILEFILNKWFNTTWVQPDSVSTPTRPDIYIDNNNLPMPVFTVFEDANPLSEVFTYDYLSNSYVMEEYTYDVNCFTIYVPVVIFTGLGADAELQIRTIADRYVIAGMIYNVTTY